MRNLMLVFCTLLILMSCTKETEETKEKQETEIDTIPATFIFKDYDSLGLKSYLSTYWEYLSDGYTFLAFVPYENIVSDSIDIDDDMIMDYMVFIRHSVFSMSPHYSITEIFVSVNSLDSNYSVSVVAPNEWSAVCTFPVGDTVDNNFAYRRNGVVVDANAIENAKNNRGNLYLGLRKQTGTDTINYGYLNLFVKMAEVTLIKSVLNTNKDFCRIEE